MVERDWDKLVDALRCYGVRYLSGGSVESGELNQAYVPVSPLEPSALLARLAQSPDPRLRQAIAAFFLMQPHLASEAPRAAAVFPAPARDHLIHGYLAAIYLQRLWWTRLRRHLGDFPLLPPYWVAELALPTPEERFGKLGLAALAQRMRRVHEGASTRAPLLGPYLKVSERLLAQLLAERAARTVPQSRAIA